MSVLICEYRYAGSIGVLNAREEQVKIKSRKCVIKTTIK